MLRRPPTTIVLQPEDIASYTQSRAHRLATLAAQKQRDERLLRHQAAQLHQQQQQQQGAASSKPSDANNASAEMDVDTEEDNDDVDVDVDDEEDGDVEVEQAGREEIWTTPTPGAARVTRRGGGSAAEEGGVHGRSQGTGIREKRRAVGPPSPAGGGGGVEAARVVSQGQSIRGMVHATERPRDTMREAPRRDVRTGTDRERQTSERTRAAERTARIMGAGGGGEGGAGTGAGRSRS